MQRRDKARGARREAVQAEKNERALNAHVGDLGARREVLALCGRGHGVEQAAPNRRLARETEACVYEEHDCVEENASLQRAAAAECCDLELKG